MASQTRKYEEGLFERLRDPEEAAAYLNAHFEDVGEDAEALFLLALRDVASADGVGDLAARANLGRESLYKALSETGNPRLNTLLAILEAAGLRLYVEVGRRKAS